MRFGSFIARRIDVDDPAQRIEVRAVNSQGRVVVADRFVGFIFGQRNTGEIDVDVGAVRRHVMRHHEVLSRGFRVAHLQRCRSVSDQCVHAQISQHLCGGGGSHAVSAGHVRPRGQHRREGAGRRVDADHFAAQLGDPGRQVVEPTDVGFGHFAAGLAEEQRLDVPDRLGAADVPEESAREQGVSATPGALFHHEDAGALVVRGDGRAGAGRAAPDDQHVDAGGVHGQLAVPQSRASGMMCSANSVIARRATSVGMPGGWK